MHSQIIFACFTVYLRNFEEGEFIGVLWNATETLRNTVGYVANDQFGCAISSQIKDEGFELYSPLSEGKNTVVKGSITARFRHFLSMGNKSRC